MIRTSSNFFFSVILLPFILMLIVSRLLHKHKDNPIVAATLSVLRLAVVGLIAAAALLLLFALAVVQYLYRRYGRDRRA